MSLRLRYTGLMLDGNAHGAGCDQSTRPPGHLRSDGGTARPLSGARHHRGRRYRPCIGEVCRKAGISEATFYNWRKRYAGLMPSEVKLLRQLEEENGKLKRLVANLSLYKAMLQDVLLK